MYFAKTQGLWQLFDTVHEFMAEFASHTGHELMVEFASPPLVPAVVCGQGRWRTAITVSMGWIPTRRGRRQMERRHYDRKKHGKQQNTLRLLDILRVCIVEKTDEVCVCVCAILKKGGRAKGLGVGGWGCQHGMVHVHTIVSTSMRLEPASGRQRCWTIR